MLLEGRIAHHGSPMTLEQRALHVGIEFRERIVGAVAAEVHAPIGKDAADAAVLLRVIAGRKAAGYQLTECFGVIESGGAVVAARNKCAIGGIPHPRYRRSSALPEITRVFVQDRGQDAIDQKAS